MEQQKTNPIAFISIMVLFGLAAFGLFKACNSCSKQDKNLNVSTAYTATELKITNNTADTYTDVSIKLNGEYFKEVYNLGAFQTITVSYIEFSKKDGTKLIPALTTLKSVYIRAYYNGEKYWVYFKV